MKIAHASVNYVKCDNIHAANGATISAYASVTALILNGSSRATLANSSISLAAVSGETHSYDGVFPSTVSFTSIDTVIVQATITATVGGASTVRVLESDAFAPSRD